MLPANVSVTDERFAPDRGLTTNADGPSGLLSASRVGRRAGSPPAVSRDRDKPWEATPDP